MSDAELIPVRRAATSLVNAIKRIQVPFRHSHEQWEAMVRALGTSARLLKALGPPAKRRRSK
jgi:hypothetical protein